MTPEYKDQQENSIQVESKVEPITTRQANKKSGKNPAITDTELLDDRDLLKMLMFSDSDAAKFLGKSRQTLTNMLGSNKDERGTRSRSYLKCSDLYILIGAADINGTKYNKNTLIEYINIYKKDGPSKNLLLNSLNSRISIDWNNVYAIIFILPEYRDILSTEATSKALPEMRSWVNILKNQGIEKNVACISETKFSADMAGKDLGIPPNQCSGSDLAQHHLPTALIYSDLTRYPDAFIMTAKFEMAPAPLFKADILAVCAENMLSGTSIVKEIDSARKAVS